MKSIISEYRSAVDELVSACRRCAELGYVTSAGAKSFNQGFEKYHPDNSDKNSKA